MCWEASSWYCYKRALKQATSNLDHCCLLQKHGSMLLSLTESRDTKHIHPIKCKDDFSNYQYFLVVLGNPRYSELSVTVQSYLTSYFMLHYKPNCPLFVLHYHRARSFILINLPWALSRLSSSLACVHNRNHFPREREQQWREGLSILQAQLKGCTEAVPDSEFQLFAPLTSEYQGDPSSGGHRGGASPGLCHTAAAAPWDAPFPTAALQAPTCFTWDSSSLWELCQNSAKFSLEGEKLFLKISFKAKHSEAWD